MLRLYRLRHHGRPLYAAERNGQWRLVDGDIFGTFTEGAEIATDGLAWLAPVTPSTFVCVESNYKPVVVGEGDSDGAPWADEPALLLKPLSAVAAPGAAIEIPRGIGRVDAQASVGVVIRKSTRRVPAPVPCVGAVCPAGLCVARAAAAADGTRCTRSLR